MIDEMDEGAVARPRPNRVSQLQKGLPALGGLFLYGVALCLLASALSTGSHTSLLHARGGSPGRPLAGALPVPAGAGLPVLGFPDANQLDNLNRTSDSEPASDDDSHHKWLWPMNNDDYIGLVLVTVALIVVAGEWEGGLRRPESPDSGRGGEGDFFFFFWFLVFGTWTLCIWFK